jgi:RNA polymerase sigma-70 factor (ECF subfamily)
MAIGKDAKDNILLRNACEKGCSRSTAFLYRRYRHYLARFIRRRVHAEGDEEDLVHAVFERILEGRCHYSGRTKARAYLTGIAKHVLSDHAKVQRRTAQTTSGENRVRGNSACPPPGDHHLDPAAGAEDEETQEGLRAAVSQLPPKFREAVAMVYFDSLKPGEAARQLGCRLETFRKRLYRARAMLRAQMRS